MTQLNLAFAGSVNKRYNFEGFTSVFKFLFIAICESLSFWSPQVLSKFDLLSFNSDSGNDKIKFKYY